MERRYLDLRIGSNGNRVVGTASRVYDGTAGTEYELYEGTVERFAPGAFDEYLRTGPDVVALFNHDNNVVLGRTPDTLKLSTDGQGLHYEIDLPDTQAARDLRTSIARNDIRGSSFAFTPEEVKWMRDGDKQVRLIKRAKVYDVSIVTKPAYKATTVGLRSELEQERQAYESELRMRRWEELQGKAI